MSLDVHLEEEFVELPHTSVVFSSNITHNLVHMASQADLYIPLWHPDKIGITRASQLVPCLQRGLMFLRARPEYFRTFNPPNGWGTYEWLVEFVEDYLEACQRYPNAGVYVWR